MKFNNFFAFAAAFGLIASMAACTPEDQPNGDPNGGQEQPTEEKSKECDLLSLKLVSGDVELEAFIYEEDRVAEIVCLVENLEAMKNATAVVEISPKATISPDPSVAADYTVEDGVAFTITSEDGTTKKTYTVEVVMAKYVHKAVKVWDKTYGALDVTASPFVNCSIAFCDKEHFATADLKVFDLNGNPVGVVNTTGLPEGISHFVCMSNTEDGCLAASIGTTADGQMAPNGDGIVNSYFYAWPNGWESEPILLTEFSGDNAARVAWYFTVSGDSKGECCLVMRSAVTANQAFNYYHYTAGIGNGLEWAQKTTGYSSADGNWGQWVTLPTGNPAGPMVICDSRGNNEGYNFIVRNGGYEASMDNDIVLWGTVPNDYPEAGPGTSGYGNYSIGHGRAFQYKGGNYLVACSSGWPSAYVTIQSLDTTLPVADQYILRTQVFDTAAPSPCSAYIYDDANDRGLVIVNIQNYEVVAYEITSSIIPVGNDEELEGGEEGDESEEAEGGEENEDNEEGETESEE